MALTKIKLTTYLLLTILFVSQSFASNLMSCEQGEHLMTPTSVVEDVHAGHVMNGQMSYAEVGKNQLSQSLMTMDCCADDCFCPVGTCASMALLGSLFHSPLVASAEKVQLPSYPPPTPYYTPLNKPPIFA